MADNLNKPDTNIDHLAAFIAFLALIAAIVGVWIPSMNEKNEKVMNLIEKFEQRAEFLYNQPQIMQIVRSSYELPTLFFDTKDFSYSNILVSVKTGDEEMEEIVLLINSKDNSRKQDVAIAPQSIRYKKEMVQTNGKTRIVFDNIDRDLDLSIDVKSEIMYDTIKTQIFCENAAIVNKYAQANYSLNIDVDRFEYYKIDPVQIDNMDAINTIIDSLNKKQVKYLFVYNQFMRPSFILGLLILSVLCIIKLIKM